MQNNRNYFIAIALSVVIVLAWQFFYMNPRIEAQRQAQEAQIAQQQAQTEQQATTPAATVDGNLPAGGAANAEASREAAVAKTARVAIETQDLEGSINLTGARLDDLKLKQYRETVDPTSPIVTLFNPAETRDAYFAELGFIAGENAGAVPGPNTVWTAPEGATLTETTPVKLTYTNEAGLTFNRTISVDEHYMFTVEDTIVNNGTAAASLAPYGRVTRYNKPTTPSIFVLHEGFLGVLGTEGSLVEHDYTDVEEAAISNPKATGGWLGITDKYWAASLIPQQTLPYEARFSYFTDGQSRYQADYKNDALSIPAGQSTSVKTLVFAGAKQV
ncbi:MAG: membrane protein insertase YidC, partial [Rhizobium rosettiformans]